MDTMDDTRTGEVARAEVYSPWAAASLVLVLVSFGGCLVTVPLAYFVSPMIGVAIFALPVIALLAVITGGVGLVQINRSGGRVGGRYAAMIGVIVGLGLAALQGSVVFGASVYWVAISDNIRPAMQTFADAASESEWGDVRALFSEETGESVSDDRLARFWDAIEPTDDPAARGEAEFGIGVLMETREALAAAADTSGSATVEEAMFPVRLGWSDGSGSIVYVYADPESLEKGSVRIADLLVVNTDGTAVTLRPDGPAAATARGAGWEVRELGGAGGSEGG